MYVFVHTGTAQTDREKMVSKEEKGPRTTTAPEILLGLCAFAGSSVRQETDEYKYPRQRKEIYRLCPKMVRGWPYHLNRKSAKLSKAQRPLLHEK